MHVARQNNLRTTKRVSVRILTSQTSGSQGLKVRRRDRTTHTTHHRSAKPIDQNQTCLQIRRASPPYRDKRNVPIHRLSNCPLACSFRVHHSVILIHSNRDQSEPQTQELRSQSHRQQHRHRTGPSVIGSHRRRRHRETVTVRVASSRIQEPQSPAP